MIKNSNHESTRAQTSGRVIIMFGVIMKFDIYGKFQLQIEPEGGKWQVYKIENGLRIPVQNLIIPSEVSPEDLPTFLDDVFHEAATPGKKVREI